MKYAADYVRGTTFVVMTLIALPVIALSWAVYQAASWVAVKLHPGWSRDGGSDPLTNGCTRCMHNRRAKA